MLHANGEAFNLSSQLVQVQTFYTIFDPLIAAADKQDSADPWRRGKNVSLSIPILKTAFQGNQTIGSAILQFARRSDRALLWFAEQFAAFFSKRRLREGVAFLWANCKITVLLDWFMFCFNCFYLSLFLHQLQGSHRSQPIWSQWRWDWCHTHSKEHRYWLELSDPGLLVLLLWRKL